MSYFQSKFLSKICPIFIAAGIVSFSQSAHATIWNVDSVLSGDGGFTASLFHEASSSSGMSGSTIVTIPNSPVISGTFNDVSGALNAVISLGGMSSFSLIGNLIFGGGGFGELTNPSTLAVDFMGTPIPGLSDTTLGFNPGFVCCGSDGDDPNSFHDKGSNMAFMTLWGADNFKVLSNGNFQYNAYDIPEDIGMDLRLKLTAVPIPAALPLFGTGLGLLGFLGWRRRRKSVAAV